LPGFHASGNYEMGIKGLRGLAEVNLIRRENIYAGHLLKEF